MLSGLRPRSMLGVAGALIIAALAAPQAHAQSRTAAARNAAAHVPTTTPEATRTRFVIGLEQQIDFEVYSLPDPNRVYIELPEVRVQLPPRPGSTPVGLIKDFRGGLSAPGRQRVVIDVTVPVVVDKAVVETGPDGQPRLVIDIVEVSAAIAADLKAKHERRLAMQQGATGLGGAGIPLPPLPRPAVSPQVREQHSWKPVIVLDPGHGGDDSGAQRNGTVEKDVVLAFSLKLRDKLEAAGRYRVLMTRDDDTFVELNARREFGERHRAQLFVAVHADYANSSARGATIYSLRPEVAHMLQRSARSDVQDIVLDKEMPKTLEADARDVKDILTDLYRREIDLNQARTSVFVKSVIGQMGTSTNLKDNPDRQAAFVVLKSAKVPSILIELGYVTNDADAQLLKSEAWREKVSTSIATAIENYFQSRPQP